MIRKHRKLILFISIIIVILIWMPSTMRRRILLIPLKYQVWTLDNVAYYRYSDLKITQKQGETYVDIFLRFISNEMECKRIISVVEKYMKWHPYLFLGEAKIGIHVKVAGESISFYNYHDGKKYDRFVKMGFVENSYYGLGLEYIDVFPDTKILGCKIYSEPDMDEWITYLSYLNNPERIYLYCESDNDYRRMKMVLNEMFPECEVLDTGEWWMDGEREDALTEEMKSLQEKIILFIVTIILIVVNSVLMPLSVKERFMLIPLRVRLWSSDYRLYLRRCGIQVLEKNKVTYVNIDIRISYGADQCKKMISLVEQYMKKHPKSFLNKAKVSITVGNRPYTISFFNYNDEKLYEYFAFLLYTGDDEKNPLKEYIKVFPKCQTLNE